MKKHLLALLCLLAIQLRATSSDPIEPIGQRLGMSLLEVLDSVHKEGIYHYSGSTGKPASPDATVMVDFQDDNGHLLTYSFVKDKCELASMLLPLADLDSLVQLYDRKFTSAGKQVWRTPYGLIKVAVVMGAESLRKDHKPHLLVIFDPRS